MGSDDLTEILARTLGQVLEEAAFVFGEATDDPPPLCGPVLQARLAYDGDHQGELVLAAPHELAATLAANLLGEEEGGAAMTGDDADAVGELLNMIAGSLLVELHGPEARCSLDANGRRVWEWIADRQHPPALLVAADSSFTPQQLAGKRQ